MPGACSSVRQLLDHVKLEGLLVQADALHASRSLFATSSGVEQSS